MEEDSLELGHGMQKVKRTHSVLNNLQVKLHQYVNKSRDTTAKRFKQPPPSNFIVPTLFFDMSSRRESKKPSVVEATLQTPLNPKLQAELQYYKNKLQVTNQTVESVSKVEEFYQRRTEILQERVREIQRQKLKVQKDRQLLGKENRRLDGEINKLRKENQSEQHRRRTQTQRVVKKGKLAKQQKLKRLKDDLERQKQVQQSLKAQIESYQGSLKLMLEVQRKFVAANSIHSQSKRRTSTGIASNTLPRSKSKPHFHNQSQTNKIHANRHRECCMTSVSKDKSKSFK